MYLLIAPMFVYAHPGRTDSAGCHTCRTNCPNWGLSYGEYHCHNAKAVPQPEEPVKSHYGESGTGYTTPAPEYTAPKVNTSTATETQQTSPGTVLGAETTAQESNSNDSSGWGWVILLGVVGGGYYTVKKLRKKNSSPK